MKKTLLLLSALALISLNPVQAADVTGEAAGAQAVTTAQGNSHAVGVAAVGALLGIALATASGGGSGTSTTTATMPTK
ncbi:exopolysaccharide production protein YjbE [[Erwinia] mediterraneensis]|uniref:exopolysaccharide production protein YjbE n=1 Tax=[Erwinia] mediterraneensis TaxID=2161819 RepID=UPI001031B47E|nr:exopolysaccharide production protein YjbE [[Erwinia] mediterraneensis]